MIRLLALLLPDRLVYADRLTTSGRRLVVRLGLAALGLVVAGVGVGLLNSRNWADVAAGALFAWATSILIWSISSYCSQSDDLHSQLRRMAELDLLHARLNHLAHRQGLPTVGLDAEIESILTAREERLAHYSGVEEFRPTGPQPSAEWWDPTALGQPSD